MARPECDTPLVLNWSHFVEKWKWFKPWLPGKVKVREDQLGSLWRFSPTVWWEQNRVHGRSIFVEWVRERERERERECEWVGWFVCRRGLSNIAGCTAFQWDGPSCTWQHTRDHEGGGGSACELDTHLLNFWWFLGPICWWWGERGGMDLWKVK
jgi:hypothetical protein